MSARERTPPCDLAAEEAVLGACLLEPAVIPLVAAILRRPDFADSRHGVIFAALLLVDVAGRPVDVVSVCDQLRRMPIGIPNDDRTINELLAVGDRQRLEELTSGLSSVAAATTHARIVAEHAARRRVIDTAETVVRRAYENAPLVELGSRVTAVADAASGIATLGAPDLDADLQDFADLIAECKIGRVTSTGFRDLDALLAGGWRGGELIIEAARPAVGKTAKALRHARLAAGAGQGPAVFLSLEMPRAQLVQRLVSAESGVPLHHIRAQQWADGDHRAINKARRALAGLPLRIFDLPTLAAGKGARPTLTTIRAALLRERARAGGALSLVVVDYLQLVRADRDREKREEEVSEVARGLKELALELDTPVVALAQLNRAIEKRGEDAEFELSDLRESGEIEQAADVVSFLARPKSQPGVLRVCVKKQRNGPTDTVNLRWAAECARPGDLAHEFDDTNVVPIARPGVRRAADAWPEVPSQGEAEGGA